MAVHSYVLSKYITGTDENDIELNIIQMTHNGQYEIDNPKDFIAKDIYYSLNRYIDSRYTSDFIRKLLDKDGKYSINMVNGSDWMVKYTIINVDNCNYRFWYAIQGDFIIRMIYTVQQISDTNLVYLVTDHVIAPEPGTDLIERCYHPYFSDMYEARQYCYEQMQNYQNNRGSKDSGFRISVADARQLDRSSWYITNLKVAESIQQHDLDFEDFRYIKDINSVEDSIIADIYEELPLAEKANVNRQLLEKLRPFIPYEQMIAIDEQIIHDTYEDIISDTDYCITLAFAHADTIEKFNGIYEALGPHSYRVGNLTDELYNARPNEGYIVVDKEGMINWYENVYAINEWDGSKGSPYHGVFQPNEPNTLLSFREFHPELFPDTIPCDVDIERWEKKYQMFKYRQRQVHSELIFKDGSAPGEGQIVCGEWFFGGLSSDESCNIEFHRDYKSHTFTKDEIIRLLNGEEIVISGFVTQLGYVVDIKGRLQDISDFTDTEKVVEFSRTDMDVNAREAFNRANGISVN